MKKTKVSIIIPVYNVEKWIGKCLDSVVNQTYGNIEIITVDDGSPDGSAAICQQYAEKDDRIVLVRKKNGGLSDARNAGLRHATGDYVFFLDSDDWLDRDAIRDLVSIAEEKDADAVTSRVYRTDKEDAVVDNSKVKLKEYTARDYVYLMTRPAGVFCYACSRLMRRSMIGKDPFPVGKVFEDIMTMPEIIWKANRVVETSARYYYYRFRRTGISHGKFSYKSMHEMDGYISVVDFADSVNDSDIARNGILFFLTKYHYYWFKIRFHKMNRKWYRDTYKETAKKYWKRLLFGK